MQKIYSIRGENTSLNMLLPYSHKLTQNKNLGNIQHEEPLGICVNAMHKQCPHNIAMCFSKLSSTHPSIQIYGMTQDMAEETCPTLLSLEIPLHWPSSAVSFTTQTCKFLVCHSNANKLGLFGLSSSVSSCSNILSFFGCELKVVRMSWLFIIITMS